MNSTTQSGEPRIGLFGGTFDPPHLGHRLMAEACLSELNLDEVIWIPNARNPIKRPPIATAVQRLQMTQLAIQGLRGMAVSDIEVSREGRSYTVETVEEMKLVQPGEYWIILGSDALANFMKWKTPDKLARMARLAVIARPGSNIDLIRRGLSEDVDEAIDLIPMKETPVSSTNVRDQITRGLEPTQWVESAVLEYIGQHGLYK